MRLSTRLRTAYNGLKAASRVYRSFRHQRRAKRSLYKVSFFIQAVLGIFCLLRKVARASQFFTTKIGMIVFTHRKVVRRTSQNCACRDVDDPPNPLLTERLGSRVLQSSWIVPAIQFLLHGEIPLPLYNLNGGSKVSELNQMKIKEIEY